jgi:response regulator RpfG family c-di-GMP phosphodiesterase
MDSFLSIQIEPEEVRLSTLLFVDDEPNILSSLRRLFRSKGYRVLTAESAAAGLEILQSESVDVVVSDMRMPVMDGAKFLEKVREQWPDTIRMLLTGYSDIQSILQAINRGEIYRYITKPWDDNDIMLVIKHAFERKELEKEKLRLEVLARRQNEELKILNASLEMKVMERTEELVKEREAVLAVNEKLKVNFVTSIKVFSGLIEMRGGNLAGHSRRVADLARKLALKMGMLPADVQNVFIAGMLVDIGKMGLSDTLLSKPSRTMTQDEMSIFRQHPENAERLLMPLADLQLTARILRSHTERHDGEGFPDRIAGSQIPMGSRILALANDFENLQMGAVVSKKLTHEEAKGVILDNAGTRYDPVVVEAFRQLFNESLVEDNANEACLTSHSLKPGMVLSRDLISKEGLLLLSADHVLDGPLIKQILDFDGAHGKNLSIWVKRTGGVK